RLHAIAPALAQVWAGEGAAAMEHLHAGVIDDVRHQRLDERRVFADVADRLVEAAEGGATDEEIDERDVARRADGEDAGAILVAGDSAADQRRGQESF